MPVLVCKKCNIYYDIDSKEDMQSLKNCETCGSPLMYFNSIDEYINAQENGTKTYDIDLLNDLLNSYESAVAKIILFCVVEVSSTLSISRIIKTLRGSKSKYVNVDCYSYSVLTNFSRKRLERYIQTLIKENYLKTSNSSRYKPVSITDKGLKFLSGKENLKVHVYSKVKESSSNVSENEFNFPNILLNDNDCLKRAHVAYLLGESRDSQYVEVLCKATEDSNGNVRRLSASALSKIGDKRAEDALIILLTDQKPQVRQYAAKALGKIGTYKSVPYLKNLANDENGYVIEAAQLAISKIEKI